LFDVTHGYPFQGEFFRTEPPGDILLTPGNFEIGGGFKDDKLKFYVGSVPQTYVFDQGDLIITMTDLSKESDTLGYPAIVPRSNGARFLHNQRLGRVVFKPDANINKHHLYYLLQTDDYRNEILAGATGTAVKHTSPKRIKAFRFPFSKNGISFEFGNLAEGFHDRIEANDEESRTLAKLRESLLPKLLNGQVHVLLAEEVVSEAV
jgi:type I restriction enzyme S subunit